MLLLDGVERVPENGIFFPRIEPHTKNEWMRLKAAFVYMIKSKHGDTEFLNQHTHSRSF